MTHAARTTAPIRTAVIGYGLSGRVFHTPFLAANDEYSLDVIVTSDPDRRAHAAREHPGARLFTRPADLLAHAETMAALDLVVIASPPATHAPLAHAALDSGLAVLVDKPFTVSSMHGSELVEKADRLGLALTVFQNRRWDGDFLTLRALVEAGTLGEVRRFESRFEWFKAGPGKAWKDAATPHDGGGLLYDLGAHLIDQAVQLFGPVDDVYAEVLTRRPGGAADDDTFVSLRHTSGTRSQLWMNGLAAHKGARFRVLGSEAGYTSWGLDGQEAALKNGARPSDDGFGEVSPAHWGSVGRDGALSPAPTLPGDYAAFYTGLADAILRGAAVPVDPRDAVRVIEIIEGIHAATAR